VQATDTEPIGHAVALAAHENVVIPPNPRPVTQHVSEALHAHAAPPSPPCAPSSPPPEELAPLDPPLPLLEPVLESGDPPPSLELFVEPPHEAASTTTVDAAKK
jgi:hypothetical protein